MAKVTAENKAGHITKGDVLEDLGFTPKEIRETEVKLKVWRKNQRVKRQKQNAGILSLRQPKEPND